MSKVVNDDYPGQAPISDAALKQMVLDNHVNTGTPEQFTNGESNNVQKSKRRSGIKGYRIVGNTVRRIPAAARLKKARLLKRSWKTTRRAKLRRSLLKRKMSMRRRASIGLR